MHNNFLINYKKNSKESNISAYVFICSIFRYICMYYVSNYTLKKTIKSPCGVRIIIMVLCNFALRTPYVYIKRKEKTTTYARTHKSICIQWRPHRVSSPLSCASRKTQSRSSKFQTGSMRFLYIFVFDTSFIMCVVRAVVFCWFAYQPDAKNSVCKYIFFFIHTYVRMRLIWIVRVVCDAFICGALRRRGNIDCFSWKIFKWSHSTISLAQQLGWACVCCCCCCAAQQSELFIEYVQCSVCVVYNAKTRHRNVKRASSYAGSIFLYVGA